MSGIDSDHPEPGSEPEGRPPRRRAGNVAVALSPLVAVTLFFAFGALFGYAYAWLWFLLIPAVAIIVYGGRGR